MILGNSFGKNKGKKYFIRGKHDKKPDIMYAEEAEKFNTWFGQNYSSLIQSLQDKNIYYDDSVNDTYIRIYEGVLYCGIDIECYMSYFFRSYYTNYVNDCIKNNRYTQLLPNFDKSDNNDEYFIELETKQKELETDIFNYIFTNYDIREFELFKMYMTLKPAVNYASLSNITGLKEHRIQYTISKIKKDICCHHDFIKRYREVG